MNGLEDAMAEARTKSACTPLTRKAIEDGLRQLGLCRGDAVEVHSSLSSLGWVEGGASTVIDALTDVVGGQGTLAMSAYPVSPPIPLTDEERARGIAWKVRILDPDSDERTGMGVVSDAFHRRPDVVCEPGPFRMCAWGRDAHRHAQSYQHLLDVDGWVLLIGVGIDRCSSMHLAERVPIPEEIAVRFRIPEDILRDYPENEWAIGYGSTPGDPWQAVWEEAEHRGLIRKGRIGQAECALFKARAVTTLYEGLRRSDPYGIFGLARPGECVHGGCGTIRQVV
jgi:aminoglycoside 3-N-acetyltransferase